MQIPSISIADETGGLIFSRRTAMFSIAFDFNTRFIWRLVKLLKVCFALMTSQEDEMLFKCGDAGEIGRNIYLVVT